MKHLLLLLTMSLAPFVANAQTVQSNTPQNPAGAVYTLGDPECGSQSEESQSYEYRFGRVIRITRDNRLVVRITHIVNELGRKTTIGEYEQNGYRLKRPRLFNVSLAGIDLSTNRREIGALMRQRVIGRGVTIEGNSSTTKIDGIVWLHDGGGFDVLNEGLLENGVARYRDFDSANIVSMVRPCLLAKAERQAKAAKRGIWAAH